MILSMTGYGKSETVIDGTPTSIEVRSVNGRYLELSIRLPREWADKESDVREAVKKSISRGSVNVYVRRESASATTSISLDRPLAKAYVDALRSLKDELGLSGDVTVEQLANYAPIFQGEAEERDTPDVTADLALAMQGALQALSAMREREGEQMKLDMLARMDMIQEHLIEVERLSAEKVPAERTRLRERVAQIVDEEAIDENRLALEIALLSEKLDISEECVRLRSHMKHVADDLTEGGVVGRKLNFQLQEMNREVNTMGSKSNDSTIARHVVMMKEELERMREQVQNIE